MFLRILLWLVLSLAGEKTVALHGFEGEALLGRRKWRFSSANSFKRLSNKSITNLFHCSAKLEL